MINIRLKLLILFLIISYSCFGINLLVKSIELKSNYLLDDKVILSRIGTQIGKEYDPVQSLADLKKIKTLYEKRGFYNVKIFQPKIKIENRSVTVIFPISENENMILKRLNFRGNSYISTKKIREQLSVGNKYLPDIPLIEQNIIKYYNEEGFFFAKIELDSLKQTNNELEAFFSIKEGKYCRFENYKFIGNKTTKAESILRIAQLQHSKRITPENILQAEELLQKKAYIKECRIIPLNENELLFKIKEDKMTFLSGIFGLNNRESSDRNRLTGFVKIDFLNLFGTDRKLSLHWESVIKDRRSIILAYHESGFFSYPLGGDFSLKREEADSTYIETLSENEVYYYNQQNRYGIYFAVDDYFPGLAHTIEQENFKKIGLIFRKENLDNYLNPHKGMEFSGKYYFVFHNLGEKNRKKSGIDIKFFTIKRLKNRFHLALKVGVNFIENKELSDFEYYKLGGHADLRGFLEDQFFGYLISWENLELRYLFSRESRFFVFLDHGYVQNNDYRYGKLFGTGFGLRIDTKVGLLGIDYGISYHEKFNNPLNGVVHFGIETNF